MHSLRQCHIRSNARSMNWRVSSSKGGALTVDGVPVETYVTRFAWDEGRYPTMSPLKDIVSNIHGLVAKIEDDMEGKVRASDYNTVRSQLNAINRKQTGSYDYLFAIYKPRLW